MKKNLVSKLLVFLLLVGILIPTQIGCSNNYQAQENYQAPENCNPLGLITLNEYMPDVPLAPSMFNALANPLPASVDLTSKFPPVGDQGRLGSCVAWAIGYAEKTYQEEFDWNWAVNTTNHQFSPAYIYSQVHASNSADGGGSNFSTAFRLLVSQGCATLSDMPYNGNSYGWQTQPTSQQKANAAKHRAASWSQLPSGNYNEIRTRLAAGVPVVIGIPVYPDFDNISSTNQVYDNTSGTSRGNHALCIIGYDDSKSAVKIINSWSTRWGLSGYGWISYSLISSLRLQSYIMTDIDDSI